MYIKYLQTLKHCETVKLCWCDHKKLLHDCYILMKHIISHSIWIRVTIFIILYKYGCLLFPWQNPRLLDDVSFHPCIRFKRWESERVLSFIPPDGNFRLISYRVSSQKYVDASIRISCQISVYCIELTFPCFILTSWVLEFIIAPFSHCSPGDPGRTGENVCLT